MIFDAHCHYDDEKFDDDRDTLLSSLPEKGVFAVVTNGTDIETSRTSLELAEKYPFVYAAVGIHPENAAETDIEKLDDYIEKIAQMLTHEKAVALGETGIDYYWDIPKDAQHIIFDRQLQLASDIKKPIIIHDREAHGDILEYLKKYRPYGLLHCYSGSKEMLSEVFRYGKMWISLGGAVTFKNARVPVEVAKEVPMDKLLLETDAPYLAPVPYRGKRCDSSMISYTAQRIANIRGMSVEDVLKYTKDNACRLYNL
ncbi:MAG: TatD family hydrolase [Clostridia bacterium]|nr:TatD family hydrolase [Clostridia bacterium]